MSELLDRIQREIRERLAASRAAVLEHERLEAALQALGDAGARATRAVSSRGRAQSAAPRPAETTRASGAAATKRSSAKARSSKRSTAAASESKRGARARAGSAGTQPSANARQASTPQARGRRRTASPAARTSRSSAPPAPAAAGRAKRARKRAPRGANREAVVRVIGERPGVTTRELAVASGVTGGTLYALLRTLTERGELEKRPLPGGQTGYVLAASADSGATPASAQPASTPTAIEPTADATPAPDVEREQDDVRSVHNAAAGSGAADAQGTAHEPDAPADAAQTAGKKPAP